MAFFALRLVSNVSAHGSLAVHVMLVVLVGLLALGAGVVGGVFFAFSSFVFRALAELEPSAGIAAMQRINVVVLRPLFLGVFVGTAILSVACGIWAMLRSGPALVVAAAGIYCLGAFGVTLAFNVPRNERLARLDPVSAEAQAYWPIYVRQWALWNHVRTVASVAAAGLAGAALASLASLGA